MGDPLVKEELARKLDRIGVEFAKQLALAASAALRELRKMAELSVDGPLEASEKLAVIQEALDRFERSHVGRPLASIADEVGRLSDDELIAHARELVGVSA